MDSTCVLIGLHVCFHSAMKHENDVSNMVACLQVVRICSFMNEIEVDIHMHFVYRLSLCYDEKCFYKRNKICHPCLHSLVKTSAKFLKILEQLKTLDCVSGFHWSAVEFSQTFASVFTRLWRHGNMFYFLSVGAWVCLAATLNRRGVKSLIRNSCQPLLSSTLLLFMEDKTNNPGYQRDHITPE